MFTQRGTRGPRLHAAIGDMCVCVCVCLGKEAPMVITRTKNNVFDGKLALQSKKRKKEKKKHANPVEQPAGDFNQTRSRSPVIRTISLFMRARPQYVGKLFRVMQ